MQFNLGGFDRISQVVVGVILIAATFVPQLEIGYWGLFGIVPLLNGILNLQPLSKREQAKKDKPK